METIGVLLQGEDLRITTADHIATLLFNEVRVFISKNCRYELVFYNACILENNSLLYVIDGTCYFIVLDQRLLFSFDKSPT